LGSQHVASIYKLDSQIGLMMVK